MGEYRLAFATLTKSQLLSDDSYIVENFPYGDTGYGWGVGADSIFVPYTELVTDADGRLQMLGKATGEWTLFPPSKRMWYWFYVTKANRKLTSDVTILTPNTIDQYDDEDRWIAVNCKMSIPGLTADILQPQGDNFFGAIKLTFFDGELAAP